MPLTTHVTDRYSAQRLVALTNPDDETASTVNTTILGFAADDVEGEIRIWAGVVYDDTDDRHIAVATECVILRLRALHQNEDLEDLREKRKNYIKSDLAPVTGRDKIPPTTDSELTPSQQSERQRDPIRPDFDREHWPHYTPDRPDGGAASGFTGE